MAGSMGGVSVVIATFGRPQQLILAVNSLLVQARMPDEIVVVAWSRDSATVALLRQKFDTATTGSKIAIETVADNTVVAKETAGIARAAGEIICFMDDDAIAHSDWLQ